MRIYFWTFNLVYASKKQIAYALVKHVEQKKTWVKVVLLVFQKKKKVPTII